MVWNVGINEYCRVIMDMNHIYENYDRIEHGNEIGKVTKEYKQGGSRNVKSVPSMVERKKVLFGAGDNTVTR